MMDGFLCYTGLPGVYGGEGRSLSAISRPRTFDLVLQKRRKRSLILLLRQDSHFCAQVHLSVMIRVVGGYHVVKRGLGVCQ
jgi:hypothetical protein